MYIDKREPMPASHKQLSSWVIGQILTSTISALHSFKEIVIQTITTLLSSCIHSQLYIEIL